MTARQSRACEGGGAGCAWATGARCGPGRKRGARASRDAGIEQWEVRGRGGGGRRPYTDAPGHPAGPAGAATPAEDLPGAFVAQDWARCEHAVYARDRGRLHARRRDGLRAAGGSTKRTHRVLLGSRSDRPRYLRDRIGVRIRGEQEITVQRIGPMKQMGELISSGDVGLSNSAGSLCGKRPSRAQSERSRCGETRKVTLATVLQMAILVSEKLNLFSFGIMQRYNHFLNRQKISEFGSRFIIHAARAPYRLNELYLGYTSKPTHHLLGTFSKCPVQRKNTSGPDKSATRQGGTVFGRMLGRRQMRHFLDRVTICSQGRRDIWGWWKVATARKGQWDSDGGELGRQADVALEGNRLASTAGPAGGGGKRAGKHTASKSERQEGGPRVPRANKHNEVAVRTGIMMGRYRGGKNALKKSGWRARELGPRKAVGARFAVNLSNSSVGAGGCDERACIWRARDQGGAAGEWKSPSGRGRKGCNGVLTSVNNSHFGSSGAPSVHGPDERTRPDGRRSGRAARSKSGHFSKHGLIHQIPIYAWFAKEKGVSIWDTESTSSSSRTHRLPGIVTIIEYTTVICVVSSPSTTAQAHTARSAHRHRPEQMPWHHPRARNGGGYCCTRPRCLHRSTLPPSIPPSAPRANCPPVAIVPRSTRATAAAHRGRSNPDGAVLIGLRKPSPAGRSPIRTSTYTAADRPPAPPGTPAPRIVSPRSLTASASPCATPTARQQRDQTKRSRAPPRQLARATPTALYRVPHPMDENAAQRHPIVGTPPDTKLPCPDISTYRRHETNGGDTDARRDDKEHEDARAEVRTRKARERRKLGHSASSLTPTPHRRRRGQDAQGYRRPTQRVHRPSYARPPAHAPRAQLALPLSPSPCSACRRARIDAKKTTGTRTEMTKKDDEGGLEAEKREGEGWEGREGKGGERESRTVRKSGAICVIGRYKRPQYMSTVGWLRRQRAGSRGRIRWQCTSASMPTPDGQALATPRCLRGHPTAQGTQRHPQARHENERIRARQRRGEKHQDESTQASHNATLAYAEKEHEQEHEQRITSSTDKRAHRHPAPDLRRADEEEQRAGRAVRKRKQKEKKGSAVQKKEKKEDNAWKETTAHSPASSAFHRSHQAQLKAPVNRASSRRSSRAPAPSAHVERKACTRHAASGRPSTASRAGARRPYAVLLVWRRKRKGPRCSKRDDGVDGEGSSDGTGERAGGGWALCLDGVDAVRAGENSDNVLRA
ncbi:hypothetical protein DFH09DRAFT_1098869 [Mycena vulgaris]|nr:hypothetical protein DFH09DRAFT_1098869 [Mycena vulgaris]